MTRIYTDDLGLVHDELEHNPHLNGSQRELLANAVLHLADGVGEDTFSPIATAKIDEETDLVYADNEPLYQHIELPEDIESTIISEGADEPQIAQPGLPIVEKKRFEPLVSNEDLIAKLKTGDEDALTQLTRQNEGLIRFFATRENVLKLIGSSSAVAVEDLLQEGRIALIQCALKYDPTETGKSFYQSSSNEIKRAILNYARRYSHPVLSLVSSTDAPALQTTDRKEIAESAHEGHRRANYTRHTTASLDTVGYDDRTYDLDEDDPQAWLSELYASGAEKGRVVRPNIIDRDLFESADSFEEFITSTERGNQLNTLLDMLTDREFDIVATRFGLSDDTVAMTLKETANEFGLTRERVRQIEAQILSRMRVRQRMIDELSRDPNEFSRSYLGKTPTEELSESAKVLVLDMAMEARKASEAGSGADFVATLTMIDMLSKVKSVWAHQQVKMLIDKIEATPNRKKEMEELMKEFKGADSPTQDGMIESMPMEKDAIEGFCKQIEALKTGSALPAEVLREVAIGSIESQFGEPKTVSELLLQRNLFKAFQKIAHAKNANGWKTSSGILLDYIKGTQHFHHRHELKMRPRQPEMAATV